MITYLTTELVDQVYGMHPKMRTRIEIKRDVDDVEGKNQRCSIGLVYQDLSRDVIVDRYEIISLFESSQLVSFNSSHGHEDNDLDLMVFSSRDLESPASLVDHTEQSLLVIPLPIDLTCPHLLFSSTVVVPLHLRYLDPIVRSQNDTIPIRNTSIDPPSLYKFCKPNQLERNQAINFTRYHQDSLLKKFDTFVVSHNHHQRLISLNVPVGVQDDLLLAELGNFVCIYLGFFWVLFCLKSHPLSRPRNNHLLKNKKLS